MAWGDLAKVSMLLESLSQMNDSGGWKLKGNGKGEASKGKASGKGLATKTCAWQECRATREQKPTLGGATPCHCCHRSRKFSNWELPFPAQCASPVNGCAVASSV